MYGDSRKKERSSLLSADLYCLKSRKKTSIG
jgi:hypothetical protein